MKRSSLVAVGVLTFLMATCAFAQVSTQIKANIPFDFTAGRKTLPAGDYTLNFQAVGSPTTFLLQGADGRSGAFLLTFMVQWKEPEEQRAELVFHRYGGRYFLAQVWMGNGGGRQLPVTKEERELARGPLPMQLASIPMRAR
jgi:hypothetical protein